MKILAKILLIVGFANPIYAQETVVIVAEKTDWRELKREKTNAERNLFINDYVQKLNNLVIEDYNNCELDEFFTNANFDHQYGSQFMHGMHGRISMRKFIIDKLTNYNLMWCVVQSKDKRIHKKYKGKSKRFYLDYSKIPFEQYSTYELVDMRLDELENEGNAGIKRN
ncbi:hypothetical protein N9R07_03735 [Flavobacteriaceae bacterium]|jgi:hypothetical protein|nr:hypothetical protein [Flavobacteriaceae bacterium]|tara:strand:- start:257 stop:760 length:504 start_codon:yes stop_codon:yes gene_type:complete